MADRTCTIEGCERPLWAPVKGWCRLHYMRWYRTGDLSRGPKKVAPICVVDGCEKRGVTRDRCKSHYEKALRSGEISKAERQPTPANTKPCKAEGCSRKARCSEGYCSMHYERWKRNGDAENLRVPSHRYRDPQGYIYVIIPGHPLHDTVVGPIIAEHRAVLFDRIGPGWHECHWCHKPISWDRRWPIHIDALVSDHLNEVRDDNRSENLVASCNPCNVARSNRLTSDAATGMLSEPTV